MTSSVTVTTTVDTATVITFVNDPAVMAQAVSSIGVTDLTVDQAKDIQSAIEAGIRDGLGLEAEDQVVIINIAPAGGLQGSLGNENNVVGVNMVLLEKGPVGSTGLN